MAVDSQGSGQFKRQVGQLIEAQVARRQAGLSGKDARRGRGDHVPARSGQLLRQAKHGRGLTASAGEADEFAGGNSQGHMEIHRCVLPFIESGPVSDPLLRMASRTPPATASDFSEMVKQ